MTIMSNVFVLNYYYTPLNVTSIRRGFVLVDKGKAEIIKSGVRQPTQIINKDQ